MEARALAEPTGELLRIAPVAVAAAEAAWLTGDSAAVREATEDALALAVRVGAQHDVASLQAWRKRAGIEEPPHPLAAEGADRLELVGEFEAAAAIWTELGRPYEAALALADVATERCSPVLARAAHRSRRSGNRGRGHAPPARARSARHPARPAANHTRQPG